MRDEDIEDVSPWTVAEVPCRCGQPQFTRVRYTRSAQSVDPIRVDPEFRCSDPDCRFSGRR